MIYLAQKSLLNFYGENLEKKNKEVFKFYFLTKLNLIIQNHLKTKRFDLYLKIYYFVKSLENLLQNFKLFEKNVFIKMKRSCSNRIKRL